MDRSIRRSEGLAAIVLRGRDRGRSASRMEGWLGAGWQRQASLRSRGPTGETRLREGIDTPSKKCVVKLGCFAGLSRFLLLCPLSSTRNPACDTVVQHPRRWRGQQVFR